MSKSARQRQRKSGRKPALPPPAAWAGSASTPISAGTGGSRARVRAPLRRAPDVRRAHSPRPSKKSGHDDRVVALAWNCSGTEITRSHGAQMSRCPGDNAKADGPHAGRRRRWGASALKKGAPKGGLAERRGGGLPAYQSSWLSLFHRLLARLLDHRCAQRRSQVDQRRLRIDEGKADRLASAHRRLI